MTSFNRIVTTLLLLVLIPIVTIGLIVPREAIEVLGDWLDQLEDRLDSSVSALELLVRVVVALLIDALLVLLLYIQVRRPAEYGVPVRKVKSGEAQIAVDSVVAQLVYHIDPLPGVLGVEPKIVRHRGAVEVALEIETVADVNMRANIEEISAVARRVIEQDMGLKLKGKPRLNLRTVAFPEQVTTAKTPVPAFAGLDDLSSAWERPQLRDEGPALAEPGDQNADR